MILEQIPLAKQVDLAFAAMKEELQPLDSGVVFFQIRNNAVGKFGVKHFPLEAKDGVIMNQPCGMTEEQLKTFRRLAVDALEHKRNWTHGEIYYEFALRKGTLCASIQFESNYNMAALFTKFTRNDKQ